MHLNYKEGEGRYVVYVGWGEEPDPADTTEAFVFTTQGEAEAFVRGVNVTLGWQTATIENVPTKWDAEERGWVEMDVDEVET